MPIYFGKRIFRKYKPETNEVGSLHRIEVVGKEDGWDRGGDTLGDHIKLKKNERQPVRMGKSPKTF